MKHNIGTNPKSQRGAIHPLMATAAVAVTLVSLVGVAAITGILPSSNSTPAPTAAMMSSPSPMVATAPMANEPVMAPAPQPAPVVHHSAPKPVATSHPAPQRAYSEQQVAAAVCSSCGRVEAVVAIQEPAKPSGLGIAAGAVLGGVLGNHVGGGNGRTLATVAGAVAGGYGGNEVEKRARSTTRYDVKVRMEDGELRTFPQSGQDGWRVGDRVKVVNGALTSRG